MLTSASVTTSVLHPDSTGPVPTLAMTPRPPAPRILRAAVLATWVAGVPSAACAATWNVNPAGTSDFPTIQDAVDAASNGDEIVLADGTYTGDGNVNVDFLGKAIMIRSAGGPELCILDAEDAFTGEAVFTFASGEGPSSVLDGVTITRVYNGPMGGLGPPAMDVRLSSPRVRNVILRDSSFGEGGSYGIMVDGGIPAFTDCVIAENAGGAFSFVNCVATIAGCTIGANSAASTDSARGISSVDSHLDIRTTAVRLGQGVHVTGGSLRMERCLLSDNQAETGAGLRLVNCPTTILSSTLARNCASTGGGIHAAGSTITVESSILWANGGGTAWLDGASFLTATCSDLDPADIEGAGTLVMGPGSITADPLFCDPLSCDDPFGSEGVYSLPAVSPVRDVPGCGTLGALYDVCTTSIAPTTWGRLKTWYRAR